VPVERDTLYRVVREHARADVPEAALKPIERKRARLPVVKDAKPPAAKEAKDARAAKDPMDLGEASS
jgi:hypothetical protein